MQSPPPLERVVVVEVPGDGRSLRAAAPLAAGDVVGPLTGRPLDAPDRYSVQVGADRHLDLDNALRFLDHGCDPSVYLDTERMACVTLRAVREGAPLTFFYPSTEWKMSAPFDCTCGADRCLGTISGAADTPREALETYRLAPHIRARLSGAPPR